MGLPLPCSEQAGQTIDFYLSRTQSTKAAKLFLGKALRNINKSVHPMRINTDKAPTYPLAISQLKALGKAKPNLEHRRVKYLNNVIEADHGKLKRLIKPTLGFKSMKTAYATIKGFEVMLAIKKGQCRPFVFKNDIMTEVRLINQQFGLFSI